MQMIGSLIPHSSPSPVAQWQESGGQVIPFVSPRAQEQAQRPLTTRAVVNASQVEQVHLNHAFPEPIRLSREGLHARRALAAYESVQQIEAREEIRSFLGVDEFA